MGDMSKASLNEAMSVYKKTESLTKLDKYVLKDGENLGQVAEFSANFLRAMHVDVNEMFEIPENAKLYMSMQNAKKKPSKVTIPDVPM